MGSYGRVAPFRDGAGSKWDLTGGCRKGENLRYQPVTDTLDAANRTRTRVMLICRTSCVWAPVALLAAPVNVVHVSNLNLVERSPRLLAVPKA